MFQEITSQILKLELSRPEDYWRDAARIPLMTRQPFDRYEKDAKGEVIIPNNEVISMPIDTRNAQSRNPFNCLVCASTGVGKTRLIKNIIKGYYKQGYKILIIEPKSTEMLNARKKGTGERLHPLDKNERLPISAYSPYYIKNYMETNYPQLAKKVKFYSPGVEDLNYVEIWQSFGLPIKTATLIIELIEKGHKNIDYFYRKIMSKPLHSMTKQAALTTLDALQSTNFFKGSKRLSLDEEWGKGNIVSVQYFSRDGSMMNTDIGLILDLVRNIGINESRKGLKNITKKLIVFDDAFYYAGISASMSTKLTGAPNLAIRNISNCQNNFRTWGIDTIFTVQSPDSNAIHPALVDGCTTKLISYVENPMALSNKIPQDAYRLLSPSKRGEPTLYVDEENYLFQWIYVQGKTRWTTGFPFSCTVGHT